MNEREAATYLASLVLGTKARPDLSDMKAFAKGACVPFPTIYHWYKTGKVPSWRLNLFDKVKPIKKVA